MALSPVDADGDLSTGGTEFLEEAAISSDPQVILGYLHLRREEGLRRAAGSTQSPRTTVTRGGCQACALRHCTPGLHLRRRGSRSLGSCQGPAAAW